MSKSKIRGKLKDIHFELAKLYKELYESVQFPYARMYILAAMGEIANATDELKKPDDES